MRSVCVTGVSCGAPRPLENGLFHGTDFYAGSSAVYQCNVGFYLLGDAKVHCSNSGKWGGNPPACLGTLLHYAVDRVDFVSVVWFQFRDCVRFMHLSMCVQMWMSVLWDLIAIIMPVVRTQTAPTPAPAFTRTVETAKTAQVGQLRAPLLCLYNDSRD